MSEHWTHFGYLLGIRVGWEEAAGLLLKASGEFYIQGRDQEADLLREYSTRLRGKSVEADKAFRDYEQGHSEDSDD